MTLGSHFKFKIKIYDQTANTNCMGPDLAGKWAVLNRGIFSQGSTERILIAIILPTRYVCIVLGKRRFQQFFSFVGQEKNKNQKQEVHFLPIFLFVVLYILSLASVPTLMVCGDLLDTVILAPAQTLSFARLQ